MIDMGSTNLATLNFNYFDVTLGAILIILSFKGFVNGFVRELFSLLGFVAGVFLASRESDKAAEFINTNIYHIGSSWALYLMGYVAILVIVWGICAMIGIFFDKLINPTGQGFLSRVMGFFIGGGKYFLIFALIVATLSNIQLVKDNLLKHVDDSKLYPYFKEVGSILVNFSPTIMVKPKAEDNTTAVSITVPLKSQQ